MIASLLNREGNEAALEIYVSCLGNASQCYLKLSQWGEAASNCSKATLDENLHTQLAMSCTLCAIVYSEERSHAEVMRIWTLDGVLDDCIR